MKLLLHSWILEKKKQYTPINHRQERDISPILLLRVYIAEYIPTNIGHLRPIPILGSLKNPIQKLKPALAFLYWNFLLLLSLYYASTNISAISLIYEPICQPGWFTGLALIHNCIYIIFLNQEFFKVGTGPPQGVPIYLMHKFHWTKSCSVKS